MRNNKNKMKFFTDTGYQDLLFLATVLHQNQSESDNDFDYGVMVSYLSDKYDVPEHVLDDISRVFNRYMEEEGRFCK